jgi:hypothetical protein
MRLPDALEDGLLHQTDVVEVDPVAPRPHLFIRCVKRRFLRRSFIHGAYKPESTALDLPQMLQDVIKHGARPESNNCQKSLFTGSQGGWAALDTPADTP